MRTYVIQPKDGSPSVSIFLRFETALIDWHDATRKQAADLLRAARKNKDTITKHYRQSRAA